MARATGGSVEFTERRKIGDYEHRDCKVILTFSVDEGDKDFDHFFDRLQHDIKRRVQMMVSNATFPAATESATAEVHVPKGKPGRKPKAAAPPPPPEDDDPTDDELDIVEVDDDDEAHDTSIDDILEKDEPKEEKGHSNADLVDAVRATNLRIKNPPAIHAYVAKFAEKVTMVPQEKRAEFLKGLKALKPSK